MLGRKRAARADGYWDFAVLKPEARPGDASKPSMETPSIPDLGAAVDSMRRIVAAAPAGTRLVLVHPPVHLTAAAAANNGQRRVIEACKAALRAAVAPREAVVADFWVEDATTRDATLFFDATHYRRPLAERIEQGIAAALARPR